MENYIKKYFNSILAYNYKYYVLNKYLCKDIITDIMSLDTEIARQIKEVNKLMCTDILKKYMNDNIIKDIKSSVFTPKTRIELKDAYDLWCSDRKKALNTYGNIKYWDISNITYRFILGHGSNCGSYWTDMASRNNGDWIEFDLLKFINQITWNVYE